MSAPRMIAIEGKTHELIKKYRDEHGGSIGDIADMAIQSFFSKGVEKVPTPEDTIGTQDYPKGKPPVRWI